MERNKFVILIGLLLLLSCEKKIEIHPENSEEKVYVEGLFTDSPLVSYIKLSKTKGIYESITGHPPITDAIVTIKDLTDNTVINCNFTGREYVPETQGVSGHDYLLDIQIEGEHITAHQTMSTFIPLENVFSTPTEDDSGQYYLTARFNDPPETEDYYLFIIQPQNPTSELDARFSVLSDFTYDRNNQTLLIEDEYFYEGEDWIVLFFHIDRRNYNYLHVILRAMKSLVNGAHPFYGLSMGNPPNTVEGAESLGFFIASPVSLSPIRIGN